MHVRGSENTAGEEIAAAEEGVKSEKATDTEKEAARHTIAAKTFDREQSKLMINALPGRNNMAIDRKQTMITSSQNDVICLLSDGLEYQEVQAESFTIDDQLWYRCGYKEGSYEDHIGRFNVCPYLSGYLGYSKMLMQCSFQFLASIGAVSKYTDTDAICFEATDAMFEQYRQKFITGKKNFGAMAKEDEGHRLVGTMPKKYALV